MTPRVTEANRPWWTLFGACTGLFVLMLDSTVVTLALPVIREDLDASASGLQWIMNAYLLVIAAFVVTAGRLGDMFGRRFLFTIGLAVFAGGSVLSGAAWSQDAIILGRIVQGLGAAMLLPLSLAIVCDAFPTEQQPRALGIWAAISALALGLGPLIGGVLVDLDWRLIFWINVPVLALGGAVMLVAVRETRDETAGHELDFAGLVLLAGALTALVLPLAEAANWALASTQSVLLFAAAAVLMVAFWIVERRVPHPIVDFALFRNGPYLGATAAAFGLVGAFWSLMFLQPQYLQTTLGYSATTAGILILPVTVPMIAISPLAGRLIARLGARALMTVGMSCGLAGLAILTQITKDSGYLLVLPGFLLFGIALGLVYAPMSTAAMAVMPREKSGIASGVLAMNRVLAGAVALAVTGAVFQDLLPAHGFAVSLARSNWVLVGLIAACTVLTWLFVRSHLRSPTTRGSPPRRIPRRSATTSITAGSTCDRAGNRPLKGRRRIFNIQIGVRLPQFHGQRVAGCPNRFVHTRGVAMTRLRLMLLVVSVAGASLVLASCGGGDGGGETSLDMTIGDSVPLSGGLADFGPPGQKAADVAVDVINDSIDEAGVDHTVDIVHEDNCGGDDQQCAVQAARKMVESDDASCIAGAWASADTIPTAESVAIPEEIPLISPASTSDEITGLDDDGLVNRTAPPDSFQGPTLSKFLVQKALEGAKGKTVNVGARNDAYGTGLADTFSAAWEEAGGTVGERVDYDIKLPNYDTEAEQLVSGNPDGLVIVDFPETYNKVGPALVRAGFDPRETFVTDGLISSDLAESAGEEAVDGLRGTAPGVPDGDPSEEAFDKLYTAAAPKDVERQTFDAQNFDAVVLCYLAAVAAGSTEGADMAAEIQDISAPGGTKYTFEQLPEAIEALQNGDDIDYQGASGPIDMNESGDATAGVYDLYEFKDGVPEPVDEIEVQKPEG